MHSLLPDYLAKLRFDAQQLATLRALGEYRGKQQLYVAQSPEVLSDLRQVAVVESTESSNRLEGVVVAAHRLKSLVLKNATPQSRSEQEVAGYRDALGLIHESGEQMPFSEGTVLQLHGILYRYIDQEQSREDIIAAGYAPEVVAQVLRLVRTSEWKRHQAAPGPKISRRAFGRERRYPISNGYRG